MWTIEWTNVKNVSEKFTLTQTICANCHSALLSCVSELNWIGWMEVAKLFDCLFVYSLQYCLVFNQFHSVFLLRSLCFSFEFFTVLDNGLNSRIQYNFSHKKRWSKRWISRTTCMRTNIDNFACMKQMWLFDMFIWFIRWWGDFQMLRNVQGEASIFVHLIFDEMSAFYWNLQK